MIRSIDSELSGNKKLQEISFILKISLIVGMILIPPVFLMAHTIKYPLYLFTLILTGLIILVVFKNNFEYKLSFPSLKITDYFLLCCSLVLLVFNVFPDISIEIPFILSIIISFFLLGWVLTRLLVIEKSRINLSLLTIAFCLSIGLTALLYFFTLITGTVSVFPFAFVGISLIPIIKDWLTKNEKNSHDTHDDRKHGVFELLVILGVTSFFVFFLITIYPEISDLPGPDRLIHYLQTKQQILTPDNYGSTYPWFHHTWGTVIEMSSPTMPLFFTGISVLSIFLIYSFYIMSKEYLKKIDHRAHLIATIFFSTFAGLGWIYFIQERLTTQITSNPLLLEWSLLQSARNISWWDIGSGQATWLFLEFRPATVSFILIFVILYLMKRHDLSKRNFIIVISFLGLTLAQIHLPEFIFFTVFLICLAIFLPKVKLRLKLTCISIFFGSVASLVVTFFELNYFGSEILQSSLQGYLVILPIITFCAYLLTLYNKRPKINFKFNAKIATAIIVSIYVVLAIIWFSNVDNWTISQLRTIFAVPVEFYPMLLGVIGIFGMIGGIIVLKRYSEQPIAIFVIIMIVGFIFARFLTFLNANVIDTSYFERRVIPIVFVSASILAPLLILRIVKKNNNTPSLKKIKDLWKVAFIASIVVGGMFSTFLTFEYQILIIENNKLTPEEKVLIESLQDIVPYSSLVTVTQRSVSVAEFGLFGQILDAQRFKLWDWSAPELPLYAISTLNSPTIFSLSDVDKKIISNEYADGYLSSHLLNIASDLRKGDKRTATYLPKLSPPISASPIVLVLPENQNDFYYAYDFLSFGNYNYTTAQLNDIETIRHANVIISPNEQIGIQLINLKSTYELNFEKIIIFNLNGYGPLVDSNSTQVQSSYIEDDERNMIQLPSKIVVNQNITATNFTAIANYEHSIPFVLQKKFKDFDVFYVNVNPILQKFDEGKENPGELHVLYSKVLEIIDKNLPRYVPTERHQFRFQPGGDFTFNNLHATGNLTFTSSSIISKIDSQINVNIDGEGYNYKDISLILPVSVGKSTIKTTEAVLENGTGFYSRILMNSSNVVFQGSPTIVSLVSKDGDIKKIQGNQIQIDLQKSANLIRQPSIQVDGIMEFVDVIAHGELEKKLQLNLKQISQVGDSGGGDLKVEGFGNFTIKFSDDYSFAHKVTFEGKKEFSENIYPYDELKNLLNFFSISNRIE